MSHHPADNRRANLIAAILISLAAFLVYADTLDKPFVYDDLVIIAENENLDDLSNLGGLFTREYFAISGERTYRPVMTGAYIVTAGIWGRDPGAFRMLSVLAHAAAGALMFFVALAVCRRRDIAVFAALIFVCHPLQSEAVNGSSFLEDPLSAVFFFGAFAAHAAWGRNGSRAAVCAAACLYLAAMFTKESAAVFILWALVFEWLRERDERGGASRDMIFPFAAYSVAALVFALVRFVLMDNPSAASAAAMPGHDVASSIAVMAVAFLKYLRLVFMPFGYSIEHCITRDHSITDIIVMFSFAIHLALLLLAYFFRRAGRSFSVGLMFYFISLIPVSNIIPFGAVMAERYMYLPMAGMSMFIAGLFLYRPPDQKDTAAADRYELIMKIFLACLCLFLVSQTLKRNEHWNSGLKLWGEAARVCPSSSRALTNYGRRLLEAGQYRDAIGRLEAAVKIDPVHYEAWNALGAACFGINDYACAERSYREALEAHPSNDVRYNLAILYLKTGAPGKALPLLGRILETQPEWPAANYLMGNALLKNNRFAEAVAQYEKVLRLEPGNIGAIVNMGAAFMRLGRNSRALELFNRALELDPGNEYARSNLELLRGKKEMQ